MAGAVLAGCLLGLADAALALGRYGNRLPHMADRLRFGLCLVGLVALAVGAAVALGALGIAALRALPSRARAAAVLAAGTAGGLAVGVAAFSGNGVRRSGLRPEALAVSVALGCGGAAWVWRRRDALSAMLQARRGTALLGTTAFGMAAYGIHATVLVRLYAGLHALLAAVSVGALAAVAGQRWGARTQARAPWMLAAVTCLGALGAWGVGSAQAYRVLARQGAPLGQYPVALLGRLARGNVPVAVGADDRRVRGPHLPLAGRDLVLVTVDALRADRLRVNGGSGRMPVLDDIAARGVVFRRAYCTTPHTSYSLASVMLGKYARAVLALPVRREHDTLARWLGALGYATAGFYPPAVFSVDGDRFGDLRARGFDFAYRREGYADAPVRVREVSDWLATRRPTERVFVWVHLFEPHEPYQAHPEHPFGDGRVERYDAEVAVADDAIGALRALFARAGRRPAWVITADHGEEFGEHGGSFHGTSLYDEQVRVPLVLDVPGVAPRVVERPVSLVDIAPTLLAGVGAERPARLRGSDFGPLVFGATPATQAFAATGSLRMVVEDSSKLILDLSDGTAELYDLAHDPRETTDLADRDPARTGRLRGMIEAWEAGHARYEAEGAPRGAVAPDTADAGAAGSMSADDDLPDVVNRAIQGDRSVALEVAVVLRAAGPAVRPRAARVLGDLGVRDAAVVDALTAALAAGDPALAREAGLSLALLGDRRGRNAATTALRDGDRDTARRAALGLARLGDHAAVPVLGAWLLDPEAHEAARDAAVVALEGLHDTAALSTWQALLGDMHLAPDAARALGALGDRRAIPALEARVVTPTYPLTIRAVAGALVDLGAPDARARVADALVVTDPLPDAWRLLRRVGEPGRLVAGHVGAVRAGPRAASVTLGGRGLFRRLYVVTRAAVPTTLTVAPYGVEIAVPAGEHEAVVEVDPHVHVTSLRLRAADPVDVLGVAAR